MSGFFGIGIYHSKTPENIGTLWRSAFAFGASFVFTVGERYKPQPTDTTKSWRNIPCWHFTSIGDLQLHLPAETELIGVELNPKAKSLPAFTHPKLGCYLLGAEDRGLDEESLAACSRLVVVPGASRCLNVSTAGSLVIYDRWCKEQKPL